MDQSGHTSDTRKAKVLKLLLRFGPPARKPGGSPTNHPLQTLRSSNHTHRFHRYTHTTEEATGEYTESVQGKQGAEAPQ